MNILMELVLVFLMCACAVLPAKRALHMFQQNRYELGRYSEWIRENGKRLAAKNAVWICLMIVTAVMGTLFPSLLGQCFACAALVLFLCGMIVSEKKQNYIKPLVYTGRVKRQIVVLDVAVHEFGEAVAERVLDELVARVERDLQVHVRTHRCQLAVARLRTVRDLL